ncbi:MAG: hypothetical protein IKI37_00975 [Oscillospiraceae bacterium]|nr:hypothetical protein [Oscillospiraceae bacterium]
MNQFQTEKCRRILDRKGFETQQDKLVDECENLIETACGEEYEPFITALAKVRVMLEQMRVSLSDEQQKEYFTAVGEEIEEQIRDAGGMYTIR